MCNNPNHQSLLRSFSNIDIGISPIAVIVVKKKKNNRSQGVKVVAVTQWEMLDKILKKKKKSLEATGIIATEATLLICSYSPLGS